MCVELLPEFLTFDPWGYPIVPSEPVPDDLLGLAKRAASDCPTLAILIDQRAKR
jgi:ferredoxin